MMTACTRQKSEPQKNGGIEMAKKYELISDLYEQISIEVTRDPQTWRLFLKTACRNYKLRFDEQLLLFAQRPDAIAVLEIERWNTAFGRWVNRGAKGIAVFEDSTGKSQRLKYYFDIADTHGTEQSREVPVWKMSEEYQSDVAEALKNAFGTSTDSDDLRIVIKESVVNAVDDNIDDYIYGFVKSGTGSEIDYMKPEDAEEIYKRIVTNSVVYMIYERLGMDNLLTDDDFNGIEYFSTPELLNSIGYATGDIARMGLGIVSKTIRSTKKEKQQVIQPVINKISDNERSSYNERNHLHNAGRLSDSGSDITDTTGSYSRQMGRDEERISEAASQSNVLQSDDKRSVNAVSRRRGTESTEAGGQTDERNVGNTGADGRIESKRHDEMGTADEQSAQRSAGDSYSADNNERLSNYKPLPSIEEQTAFIEEFKAEVAKASAFSVSPEDNSNATLSKDTVTITCNWSESNAFEDGKTYSVAEFDRIMEQADREKQDGWQIGIEKYGSAEEWKAQDEESYYNYLGYDKTKFTVNMPNGKSITERQDIGDGYGGVISFFRSLKSLQGYVPLLEVQREIDNAIIADNDNTKYRYTIGDTVFIGASEYSITAIDDQRVMLSDTNAPFFNKEYDRAEFDQKIKENSLNEHLKVTSLPEESTEIINAKAEPEAEYEDAFFIDREQESVTWMYFNPDSNAGGQYVTNTLSFDEIREAAQSHKSADDFFDYLGSIANQTLSDVGTEWFEEAEKEFHTTPDFSDCSSATMEALIENVGKTNTTVTNIEIHDDISDKEQKPVAPAWEQRKKSKVKSFDLHPDVPMSERNNFDLRSNPVEQVGKKERFRRNAEAIKVLKECEFDNRFATPEEQEILSQYVGWGGIPEAFDENNPSWADEFIELYTALSPDEYESARASTLTAFYTPPVVISSIYKAMEQMGFREGNILEPSCGIGNFIGMLPQSMQDSKIYGVEIDKISAGIAQQLYQKTSIAAQPFEEANIPDSFFDAVIGNVPFGDIRVNDRRYNKHNFLIHDYFFAKSLDKLRPGGVMALITSKGTMDKENPAVRKYIAQRADLLGAIRLPNNTFKGNAGTEVVSDILILQKRNRLIDLEPEWVHLNTDENGVKMNAYFVAHPEMVLGEWKTVSGRFGEEDTVVPYENADLAELLDEAISNIHAEITDYEVDEELTEEDNSIPADPEVRNFSYTVVDDKIYYRENSRMTPVECSATAENRIKGMIAIRDSVRSLIEMQTAGFSDDEVEKEQQKLNALYDTFSKKYGLINSRANVSAFSQDSSFALLSALEVLDENGELERKADMFTKRTIKPHTPVTSVDTASEALAVSMGEKACVDMEYMCSLTGKTEQEIYGELKGVIFLNPMYGYGNSTERKYLMADEYLSGNVREKLAWAKKSAEVYPEDYNINVEALEKVQPKDLTASEIFVQLGTTWLPEEIAQQFMYEFLDTPVYARWNIKVHYSKLTGEWNVEGKSYDRGNLKAYNTYGTKRVNAYKIIEDTLNMKDVRVFDYMEDDEGKKRAILNKKETAIAQSKQELIKQGFQDWVWRDPARREKLVRLYNDKFNSIRPREYDGSHIIFSGMNPEIELREHQKNAVAHILYGGNTLLAHAVGAGKTFEMTAAAMESKRLGLCNKSLFVVPNHLTEQWAAEFLQLYPAANILVATKKDFEMKNRKRFCGRIATGDYDAVIIGHSQFEKIPISIERQRAVLEQQLSDIIEGIADIKRNRGDRFSVKQLEKTKKSLQTKLEKLNDQSRKDDVVTFEELGIDRLFIDESHYYKNLYLYTKMRNVGGIAQTEAQKSSDLFMKCRYLDEITGGRGVVFATGTPISNSMVELYTIQRYLQYRTLQEHDLQHFDAWASMFGETVTAVELTPEGYTLIGR